MSGCSLQLDLRNDPDVWYWRISLRRVNTGDPYPLHWDTVVPAGGPEEFVELIDTIHKLTTLVDLRRHGKSLASRLFSANLIDTFSQYDKGDIHFMVPAEWGDIPFELCFLDGIGFLGTGFEVGTSICRSRQRKYRNRCERVVVRVTDDDQLPYNHKDADTIVELVKHTGMNWHLFTTGGARQLIRSIEDSTIFHFSGRSELIDGKACWLLEGGIKLDIGEIAEELEHSPEVPYLVFSNSCRSGTCGSEMSGIAGGFIKSGVPQVVGTVRLINDRKASDFVSFFYRRLFRRTLFHRTIRPARALLSAKKESIQRDPESLTPHFYRLFGDPLFCRSVPSLAKRFFVKFAFVFVGALTALLIVTLSNVAPPVLTTCNSSDWWVKSGKRCKTYDALTFKASGQINLSIVRKQEAFLNKTKPPFEDNGPEGFTDRSKIPRENKFNYFVLPSAPMGALLAGLSRDSLTPPRLGTDSVWYVSKDSRITVPYEGYLWFTVNDIPLDSSRKQVFDLDPRKDSDWDAKWNGILADRNWKLYFTDNGGSFTILFSDDDRIFTRLFAFFRSRFR